jgi:hypothetical protein
MRVLIVEDETYLAEAIRDGLRLDAIAERIVVSGNGMPILMLTAADRLGGPRRSDQTTPHPARARGRRSWTGSPG